MKVLLVEDNPVDARLIREFLKEPPAGDFQLEQASRLDQALERLGREAFDALLLDLSLPDSQGLPTLLHAQQAGRGLPIVVLTGFDDQAFAMEAVRAGTQDYLVKGRFDSQLLVRSIRYAVERHRAEEAVHQLNAQLELRVAERTAQLETANEQLRQEIAERKRAEAKLLATNRELEQFNQAMVGRELRMIELKKEINALCAAAGQPPRYELAGIGSSAGGK